MGACLGKYCKGTLGSDVDREVERIRNDGKLKSDFAFLKNVGPARPQTELVAVEVAAPAEAEAEAEAGGEKKEGETVKVVVAKAAGRLGAADQACAKVAAVMLERLDGGSSSDADAAPESPGGGTVAVRVKENCVLEELSLYCKGVTDAGAKHLAAALARPVTLTKLMLARNHIRSPGCEAIAGALRANDESALEFLNLGGNGDVGDEGAIELIRALGQSNALTTLRLWKCGLTDAVCPHIVEALRERRLRFERGDRSVEPIKDISLFDNDITPECERELEQAARENNLPPNVFHFQDPVHDKVRAGKEQ